MPSSVSSSRVSRRIAAVALAAGLSFAPTARATRFVSSVPAEIAAFKSGATVFDFDTLRSVYPLGGGGFNGTPVPDSGQLVHQYWPHGVLITGVDGPAAVINISLCCLGDQLSLPNMLAGTTNLGAGPLINYYAPLTVRCVVPNTLERRGVDRIGAWNDRTGSRIRLVVYGTQGAPIDSVESDQGKYLGIQAPGISFARFSYLFSQSVNGFTLDDLVIGLPSCVIVR